MANQSLSADENSASLRELAERLLQLRFPDDPNTPGDTRLLVGTLPAALPVEIPLPDGCPIVGSVERARHGVTAVLDCTQPPAEILDFYKQRLTAAGWTSPETPHMQGGFQHTFFANHATYCYSARGPALSVQANAGPNAPSDVRLDLQTDPRFSPCSRQHRMATRGLVSLIPALSPPQHSRQLAAGGGGGGTSWRSDATLQTDLDLDTLASHYGSQLESAGWTSAGTGQDGPLAWSTSTFRDSDDEPWRGLFFILKRPDAASDHFLTVRVDAEMDGNYPYSQVIGSSRGSMFRG
jgi:hypothetical protein